MAFEGKKILAVVPARGGSKSIPYKNLCKVGGISLICRTAGVIDSLPWIDKAILSTDDEKIASEGKNCRLEVPFLRPAELASDSATSADMWKHAWLNCEKTYGCKYDISILLEPTSPLRIPEDIERTVKVLLKGDCKAAATVSRMPAHFTPHKTLLVKDGRIDFYMPKGKQYSIRQEIPEFYHRNGVCYAVTRDTLLEHGNIIEKDCAAVIIKRPVVNIDEPFELELAEWLLSRQQK